MRQIQNWLTADELAAIYKIKKPTIRLWTRLGMPHLQAAKYWLEVHRKREWGGTLPAEGTMTNTSNFYLTLIKVVQNQGVTSSVGEEMFEDEDSDALNR